MSINELSYDNAVSHGDRPLVSNIKRKVLRRVKNADYRGREHLETDEVTAMIRAAAQRGRHGQRDAALILLTWRHGLRVSEACGLRWDQVDLRAKQLYVRRAKGSAAGMHPLQPDEIKALRALEAAKGDSVHVFANERGGALAAGAVRQIVKRSGDLAGLALSVHPHMLRHACGFALLHKRRDLRQIQAWLGHVNLAHTARYTALLSTAFDGIWD